MVESAGDVCVEERRLSCVVCEVVELVATDAAGLVGEAASLDVVHEYGTELGVVVRELELSWHLIHDLSDGLLG